MTDTSRSAAAALEEEMTDAGKPSDIHDTSKRVLFIQFDDSDKTLVTVADDLLHRLRLTGRFGYRVSWEAGMEQIEVFELD